MGRGLGWKEGRKGGLGRRGRVGNGRGEKGGERGLRGKGKVDRRGRGREPRSVL